MLSVNSILGKNASKESIVAKNPCSAQCPRPYSHNLIDSDSGPMVTFYANTHIFTQRPEMSTHVIEEIYDDLFDDE